MARPSGAAVIDVACLGTSLTWKYEWITLARDIVADALDEDVTLYNWGGNGQTSLWGVTVAGQVAALRPRAVTIEFAVNDCAHADDAIPLSVADADLTSIISTMKAVIPANLIFLMTTNPLIVPAGDKRETWPAYFQQVRDIAAREGVGLIDMQPLWGTPTLVQIPDGIHPTAAMEKAITAPAVASALAAAL